MNKTQSGSILQEKKIHKLFTKVTFVSIICFILFVIFIINIKVILDGKTNTLTRIQDLRIENMSIISEIENFNKKSKIAETYLQVWENDFLPKQKKLEGIDIESLQLGLEKLARETILNDLTINFSPVILAGRNLEKPTVKVYTTLVSIRFTSVTDVNVFMFLDRLKNELGYFITVQDINLKRVGKVNQEMLDALSNGDLVGNVEGDIKIRIYGLGKEKN